MEIYNYIETEYKDGTQCKIYTRAYKRGEDKPEKKKRKLPRSRWESTFKEIPLTLSEKLQVDEIEKRENSIFYSLSQDQAKNKIDPHTLQVSTNRTKNKIYEIARSNIWDYMITLTFDPQLVDRYDYDEITKTLTKWLNNVKHTYAPDLKYLIVPELHKDGAYHFHGLLSNTGRLVFLDSGKVERNKDGSKRLDDNENPIKIYNLVQYYLGFSNCTKIRDNGKAVSYISKYITKELMTVTTGKKRYWRSNNLEKPVVKRFFFDGSENEHIRDVLAETCKSIKTQEISDRMNKDEKRILQKITYIEMD